MQCDTKNVKYYIFMAAIIEHPFKFWYAACNPSAKGLSEALYKSVSLSVFKFQMPPFLIVKITPTIFLLRIQTKDS